MGISRFARKRRDGVERIALELDHPEWDADEVSKSIEQSGIFMQTLRSAAGMFVPDDAQSGVPTLIEAGQFVLESVEPTTDVSKLAVAIEDDGEQLVASEAGADVSQCVGLLGNHNFRVSVQQRANERASASRVAEQETEPLDVAKRSAVPVPADGRPPNEASQLPARLRTGQLELRVWLHTHPRVVVVT